MASGHRLIDSNPDIFDEVRFILYTRKNEAAYAIFADAMQAIMSRTKGRPTLGSQPSDDF